MLLCILKNCDLSKAVFLDLGQSLLLNRPPSQQITNISGWYLLLLVHTCSVDPKRYALQRVVQYTQLEAICLWYLRFDKPEIDVWTLFHTVDLDFEGGLKMWAIPVDLIESTRIIGIDWGLWPRFKNEEGSCIVILRILTSGGLCRVGWKCCRFDSIRLHQHESFPLLSIHHAGSRFARRKLHANRVESSSALDELTQFLCIGHGCGGVTLGWSSREKKYS